MELDIRFINCDDGKEPFYRQHIQDPPTLKKYHEPWLEPATEATEMNQQERNEAFDDAKFICKDGSRPFEYDRQDGERRIFFPTKADRSSFKAPKLKDAQTMVIGN